jgi:hypothetical protein
MTEHASFSRASGLRRGPIEPLSPQAWQCVESAVFSRLDAAAVPWSLAPAPLHSDATPSMDRPLRVHWATSVGFALVSAATAASALHLMRPPPSIEAGPPAELAVPAPASPERHAPESGHAAQPAASHAPPLRVQPSPAAPPPLAGAPFAPPMLTRSTARRDAPQPPSPGDDRERLFERAASLESADAPLALALYLSLASGEDAWAANALYAAARLEIDRGLREAGAEHLQEYMARFPRGENAVDVRGLRLRVGLDP